MTLSSFARSLVTSVFTVTACSHPNATGARPSPSIDLCGTDHCDRSSIAPMPDPRVGLKAGLYDAGQAAWNMRLLSNTRSAPPFQDETNSDLAFVGGHLVIQGNYNGWQIWDISDPAHPTLESSYVCPASQSDVSVYQNLLFESAEAPSARLDCGSQGVRDTVSADRIRGIRIFDISDVAHPKIMAQVQTCRGSHTHTLLVDPKDRDNVYIYISGSSFVRPRSEMPGCVDANPDLDPNGARFRIEVIKVPLAHPEQAAIVSSPRIFTGLVEATYHGLAPEDKIDVQQKRAAGKWVAIVVGQPVTFTNTVRILLDSIVHARGGTGAPTAADSAALRQNFQETIDKRVPVQEEWALGTSCHDITVYPAIGLAGGACEGHGLLLDIADPTHPQRLDAVADSNFSYWHSATFNNDGTKILFTDEWGGGSEPKCRGTDPRSWGADAIFTIENRKMVFQSYYKLPAVQTSNENCVAHNGSLIPIPGRDVMVQAWYQGGISVFDWTDPKHPTEIAFFDRGPVDSTHMVEGGSWSAYWYNGHIVSSEIARGLDVLDLEPSPLLSANEIAAAKTVTFDAFNTQGQPALVWPATFVLARAYLDQLERSRGLSGSRIAAARSVLGHAEHASANDRRDALTRLATQLDEDAPSARDGARVRRLATAVRALL